MEGTAISQSSHLLPMNYCGQPAVVLRAGLTANGLPCAVQLVAYRCKESLLLTLAATYEQNFHPFDEWPTFPFRAAL